MPASGGGVGVGVGLQGVSNGGRTLPALSPPAPPRKASYFPALSMPVPDTRRGRWLRWRPSVIKGDNIPRDATEPLRHVPKEAGAARCLGANAKVLAGPGVTDNTEREQ